MALMPIADHRLPPRQRLTLQDRRKSAAARPTAGPAWMNARGVASKKQQGAHDAQAGDSACQGYPGVPSSHGETLQPGNLRLHNEVVTVDLLLLAAPRSFSVRPGMGATRPTVGSSSAVEELGAPCAKRVQCPLAGRRRRAVLARQRDLVLHAEAPFLLFLYPLGLPLVKACEAIVM
eukprot:CAMPEP_0171136062 /NCGR_PEP_ID=MMETSP0766_2-20121228/130816_1 /TAXON_ID=439317 /ORGANISM="Gambierdiscus australes, Strain CAWD 149" /LENGTH=176 /DNA_ID=CAMNT_0011599581 /DNA_START=25 /DNA_END=555 /DNA_ORIENTATION=+